MCGMLGGFHEFVNFGIPFKHFHQVTILIINCQQRRKFDPVERAEKVFHIPPNVDVRIFMQIELLAELPDLGNRLKRRHNDLGVFQLTHVFSQYGRLLTAMVTVGAEQHDDHWNAFFNVPVGEPAGAVFLENTESGKGGIFQVWGIRILRTEY